MSGGRILAIGYGAIVRQTFATLAKDIAAPLELLIVVCKPGAETRARDAIGKLPGLAAELLVTSDIDKAIATKPTFAVEAAGHEALRSFGPRLLEQGIGLLVSSVGALAHEDLRNALDAGALRGGATYATIPGAIGGLDILAAAKLAGIESLTYTGRKPPGAWKGTRAEKLVDLDRLSSQTIFFEGDAGTAARDYPQNANVAATLALAGIGFQKTLVRLVADPEVSRNVHEISVRSACADFTMRIEGRVSPDNPKTSMTVAYSMASTILQRLKSA
jgi:aspartate dehydrogenase